MPPSYREALNLITTEARHSASISPSTEKIHVYHALNRISEHTQRSPQPTPRFDTSAMDGYALNSAATKTASPESPIVFCVKGIIAAGDEPVSVSGEPETELRDGLGAIYPCVEIMTGARFPETIGGSRAFDCCVKVEDVEILGVEKRVAMMGGNSYIKVMKPAQFQQNRRLAGNDFGKDDVIVDVGEVIRPRHIMALASVGLNEVPVVRRPRIGAFSTGSELLDPDTQRSSLQRIQDANGPYIMTNLEDYGADVEFLGVLDDGADTITRALEYSVHENKYDMIISTGGVSTGRFDLVPAALQRLGARIVFHKIDIRPGHPVLFAKIPRREATQTEKSEVAFFGMPGNPVASAACLRFLVVPYLQHLWSEEPESPLQATARRNQHEKIEVEANGSTRNGSNETLLSRFPVEKDVFRPGFFYRHSSNELSVIIINDYSPGKIKPFLASNCWIHVPEGQSELHEGAIVDIIPND